MNTCFSDFYRKVAPLPSQGISPVKYRTVSYTPGIWDKHDLFVTFLDGSDTVRQRVRTVVDKLSQVCGLRFHWPDPAVAPGDIRVSFAAGGSWSYIGKGAADIPIHEPTMQLGWITESTDLAEVQRVTLHEFGHAVGLEHEHSHPLSSIPWDREAVLAYYADYGWKADQIEYNVLQRLPEEGREFTSYDRSSIMLYPIMAELVTDDSYATGWNMELSEQDKRHLRHLYPQSRDGMALG